jgi:DNA-binding beta-propeller fold protein YncE
VKRCVVLFTFLVATTVASAQWLERTFWLFDSFPDLGHANVFFENPVTQRIYFAGRPCARTNVYDPGAGAKFGYYDSARRCIAVAHCPEAHRVWFCAYTDGALAAFDDRADTLVQMVKDVVRNPAALVYSPGMSKLYVGSNGAALVLPCDAATGEVLDSVSVPWRVTCMVYDSLRNRLYVSGREWDTSAAVVVECVGDSVIANIPGTTHMSDMVLSPDLSRLYCLCVQDSVERNVVRIVDLDSLAVTDSIVIPLSGGWPLWGRLMPDFEHGVMWTGRVDPFQTCEDVRDTLAVIDVSGDSLLTLVGLHSGFGASCFAVNSSEGKLYLTPSLWDSLAIVRPDGSLRYADIPSPRAPGVVWSRAYNRAFVVGEDDTVLVYDAAGDTLVGLVDYAGLVVDWASWNPGSRRLYVGNRNGVGWLLGDTLGEWCPFHLSGASTLLAYLPELDRLYLGGRRDTVPCVVVYDCGADSVVAVAALPERVDCALPLPDHQKMYVALGRGDSAAVYDMSSDSVVGFVDLEGRSLMEYNRCADLVYACSTGSDGVVAIIDPEIDSVVGLVSLPPIWDLGVNERDNELWVLTQHDTLLVIDCESNQHVDTILLPPIVGWNPEVCIVDEDSKAYCLGAATADVVDWLPASTWASSTVQTPRPSTTRSAASCISAVTTTGRAGA